MKVAVVELPRPELRHIGESLGPLLLVTWVFFAYDISVLDLQSTKRAAFIVGTSIWALFALVRGLRDPEHRLAFGVPLLILGWALLPAVATGAPVFQVLDKPIYFAYLALAWAVMRRSLKERTSWTGLLWGLTGLALVTSGAAIVEVLWLGGEPTFGGAPVVTFGNPNHLGAALVLLMPPVLACLESRSLRVGVLTIAAITMIGIGLTGSYLALLGGSAVLGISAASPTHPPRRRILIGALLMLSLAGGFFAQSFRSSPVSSEVQTDAPETGFSRALKGRLYLVERGAEVVARAPLTGVGVGEYPWGFATVQAEHLEENPEDLWLHTRLEHAHNDLLELLAEYGLLGLLGLGLGLGILRGLAARRPMDQRSSDRGPVLPAFATSGLALSVILMLGHFILFVPQVAIMAVVFTASFEGRRVRLERWQARALGVVTMLLVVVGLAIAIRAYSAERLLVSGIQEMEAGHFDQAEADLAEAQSRHPDPKIAFYRGTARLLAGDPRRAAEILDYAAWLLPYSEVHLNHGLALCDAGYDNAAIEALETAVRLDPGNRQAADALVACRTAINQSE